MALRMGLTPLEGLMMGTRSGDIDACLLYTSRLAGFCGQYHGSGACITGRLFPFKAKDEIGL